MKTSALVAIGICSIIGTAALAKNFRDPSLVIEGAKIRTGADARRVANDNYYEKMKLRVLATEGVNEVDIIKLGFDMKGFAAKSDKIWEARVTTVNHELRAIMWIHPYTGAVRFVIGP